MCSAIAAVNASSKDKKISACVVDVDPQGSISIFSRAREAAGLPDHSIEFREMSGENMRAEDIIKLDDEFDFVFVDVPGFYNHETTLIVLQSDLIVMPVALAMIEVAPATEAMNQLLDVIETKGLDTKVALLVSRMPLFYQFFPPPAKALLRHLRQSEYPILDEFLPAENAIRLSTEAGSYLFEMGGSATETKQAARAQDYSEKVLNACVNYTILKPAGEE
jgi:cellulose biosynthesis protein BcsQ